jgi:hypothetical protein
MTSYLFRFGLLFFCLGLPGQISLRALDSSANGAGPMTAQHRSFMASDDWELPTFVANPGSNSDGSFSSPKQATHASNSSRMTSSPSVAHAAATSSDLKHPAPVSSSRMADSTPAAPQVSGSRHEAAAPATPTVASSGHELKPLSDSKQHRVDSRPMADETPSRPAAMTKGHALTQAIVSDAMAAHNVIAAGRKGFMGRLARLTAYWAGEGDYYTGRRVSATGIHLHGGHCAVDPSIIPYGSVVEIPGVGQYLAVDTGSAVVSRTAAREAGHTRAERGALVIDLFFEHRSEGESFAANGPKFVSVSWWTPSSTSNAAREARSVFADEDWNKIYSKQL